MDGVGVGKELKRILKRFGLKPKGECQCIARAKQMDEWGPAGCEENLEEIVDWLAEEAAERYLPFSRTVGRILVRRAIKNTRKKLEMLGL